MSARRPYAQERPLTRGLCRQGARPAGARVRTRRTCCTFSRCVAWLEIALVSSRKPRLQQWADEGKPGAAAALALSDNPLNFLSTVQVGITVIVPEQP